MLRFALNKLGVIIHVTNASRTETYYCPFCGCPMQIRYISVEPFFLVAPGEAHADKRCKGTRYQILDVWMTSEKELKTTLLLRPNDNGGASPKKKLGTGKNDALFSRDRADYAIVPVRFLADFRRGGIGSWPADTTLNGCKLTDLFVSRVNAEVIMNDNDPLGFRIVDVKFICARGNILRFAMFAVKNEEKKVRYFELVVEDKEEYEILRYEAYNCKRASYYIAGVWESVDYEIKERSSGWVVVGIQRTKFTSTHQIHKYGHNR